VGILDGDSSSSHFVNDNASDELGEGAKDPSEAKTEPVGKEDREGQTPDGKEDLQSQNHSGDRAVPGKGSRIRKSILGYEGFAPKVKFGHKCLNCPHSHLDHGMYDNKPCLYDEECKCVGLKLENSK